MTNTNFLAWIDLEMTGLDPEKHHIIEIGSLITDVNLNIVEEGPNIAISQQQDVLDLMDEWNVNQHSKTCLLYTSPSPRDREKSRMPSSA